MIAEIERALLAQCVVLLPPGFSVEPYPDRPSTYPLHNQNGALLLAWHGARLTAPQATDLIVQAADEQFVLTLLVRNLRDHLGAYPLITALRVGLTGFMLPHAHTGCWFESINFISEDNGIWQFDLRLIAPTVAVQDQDPPVGPVISSITPETPEIL